MKQELKCDLTVDQIKITEKEDGTTFTAVLSGNTCGIKMTVKADSRDTLEEYGINEVDDRRTVVLRPTNSKLEDF